MSVSSLVVFYKPELSGFLTKPLKFDAFLQVKNAAEMKMPGARPGISFLSS
jgi:hypothetical protein